MATGTVKFFNQTKGFGFIQPNDGSKDAFVHENDVKGTITDGDPVTYDVEMDRKGPKAVNVSKTEVA